MSEATVRDAQMRTRLSLASERRSNPLALAEAAIFFAMRGERAFYPLKAAFFSSIAAPPPFFFTSHLTHFYGTANRQ